MKNPLYLAHFLKVLEKLLTKKGFSYLIRAGKVRTQLFPGAEQMPKKSGAIPVSILV